MKYDLTKKATRGAQRTLMAFSDAMYKLLEEKSYDDISINEICQISNFPRATFYNYFEDKKDLLNYCWLLFKKESKIEQYQNVASDDLQEYLLSQIFEAMDRHRELLTKLAKNNAENSSIVSSIYEYFKNEAIIILKEHLKNQPSKVPLELIAEHYSNTILLVLRWIFIEGHPLTKREAMEYVDELLKN
jgi:AcrR family transcriptional regulator